MGEKEERGIVNITKRSKDDDDDYGSAGSWQERRALGQLHQEVGGPPPCSERRGGKTRRGGARGEGGWSPHFI